MLRGARSRDREAHQPLHPHLEHRGRRRRKEIIAGNARVIRARLSDAKFFYETDLKIRLEERLPKFKDIIFHEKLGTQYERIERIARLAVELAPLVGADRRKPRPRRCCARRSAHRSRRRIPRSAGHDGEILRAGARRGRAVAQRSRSTTNRRAERSRARRSGLDRSRARRQDRYAGRLLGDRRKADWEKDPFALRRAALGVIRIILSNEITLLYLSG